MLLSTVWSMVREMKKEADEFVLMDDVLFNITKHKTPVMTRCSHGTLGDEFRFADRDDAECVVQKVVEYVDKSPLSMDVHVIELIPDYQKKVTCTAMTIVIFRCGNLFRVLNDFRAFKTTF